MNALASKSSEGLIRWAILELVGSKDTGRCLYLYSKEQDRVWFHAVVGEQWGNVTFRVEKAGTYMWDSKQRRCILTEVPKEHLGNLIADNAPARETRK